MGKMKNKGVGLLVCAYCRGVAEGEYQIHRDGLGVGPTVDLCNACGSGAEPTCGEIWDRIAQPAAGEYAHKPLPEGSR